MAEEHIQKKLAAIPAANVNGYCYSVDAEEVGTVRCFETLQIEFIQHL